MRAMKIGISAAILLSGFFVYTSSMSGTREYAKKEKKSCTFCHAKVTSDKAEMVKNLNAVGACYKEKAHSLATCEAAKK
jgi:hypothetical protein